MKTLQEIKLIVAKKNDCDSWSELISCFHKGDHEEFYDMVSMLYANQKLQFAIDNINWNECYEGGQYCSTERHEKSIESLKDII